MRTSTFAPKRLVSALLTGVLLVTIGCGPRDPAITAEPPRDPVGEPYSQGVFAVAAANPLATDAGIRVLQQGGSAVDAAVAIQAVLGLVEPQSSGLGGGAFMLYFDAADGTVTTYDGREIAPASATPDMFLNMQGEPLDFYARVTGGRSVGVPGVVAMLGLAHERHGTLPLAQSLAPARALAEDGFPISPRLNGAIERLTVRGRLRDFPSARDYFLSSSGEPLPVGHLRTNPDYAALLNTLSENGSQALYEAPIANDIIDAVNQVTASQTLTLDDFGRYQPVERDAVCVPYRDKRVCSMGPPSSGGVTVLQILKLLSHTAFNEQAPQSVEAWHLLIEASRLAYADRNTYVADPDYMSIGGAVAGDIVTALLDDEYLQGRASLIDIDAVSPDTGPGELPLYEKAASVRDHWGTDNSPEYPSTSHFSVIDAKGNAVSMTTSVEFMFGSHILSNGMFLNNQLTDFSATPTQDGKPVANAAAPGKRPRSSMTPILVFNDDGSLYAVLGSPGGSAIIGFLAKTLVAVLDWDMPVQDAIELSNIIVPRGEVLLEAGEVSAELRTALEAAGHAVRELQLTSGIYGFVITDGHIQGGVDPRREGSFRTGGHSFESERMALLSN